MYKYLNNLRLVLLLKKSEIILALNNVSIWIAQKNIDSIVDMFECPLPVYINDNFALLNTRSLIHKEITRYVYASHSKGIARAVPELVTFEDCTDNRCLVLVDWQFLRGNGNVFSTSKSRYVFRRRENSALPRLEMIETLKTSFPELHTPKLSVVPK